MKLVTVYTALNSAEAQLARARLEVAGFHPLVTHELAALHATGSAITTGGIRVQVPEVEAEEARAFLAGDSGPAE